MKRLIMLALGLALVAGVTWGEPYEVRVSVTQANQYVDLKTWTKAVTIIGGGANTCYFRLFTDRDTPAAATTAAPSITLAPGESLEFTFLIPLQPTTENPSGARDSESYNATGQKARYYKSIAAICAAGQTATWRVVAK